MGWKHKALACASSYRKTSELRFGKEETVRTDIKFAVNLLCA